MKTLDIKWTVDHDHGEDSFMLVGDYNGIRFVEGVYSKLWSIPLLYKKWLITLKFKVLSRKVVPFGT